MSSLEGRQIDQGYMNYEDAHYHAAALMFNATEMMLHADLIKDIHFHDFSPATLAFFCTSRHASKGAITAMHTNLISPE